MLVPVRQWRPGLVLTRMAVTSMTGFGRGEASNGAVSVVVELKSVNNRFRDVQLRLPREYAALEPRVQAVLRDGVQRGRVDATVRRTSTEGSTRVALDVALLDQYRRAVAELGRRLQRDPAEVPLQVYLAQPGVLVTGEADADPLAEWEIVETALRAALDELLAMRRVEGTALAEELRAHLGGMTRLRVELDALAEGVGERLRARLVERVTRLLGERVDAARVAQEAALLAEKADVAEELARLASHVAQAEEALAGDEPVGRKLDFLLQEMHREINTIGSKAAELSVTTRVVELKGLLERVREQAANLE